ncbi:hypothetical protein HK099_002170 [Clydaea vesicula]|uniref:Zn(2)-C6 fungal-type domain-containing protein n=1 Tax=Clydaea vesicula TaxID=447962 RepID=A0AAD5Y3T7_9FUNG|nr:hypothetical protein HK099_002170 [Clydaea vesicula]
MEAEKLLPLRAKSAGKTKCDTLKPTCSSCKKRNLDCVYRQNPAKRGPPSKKFDKKSKKSKSLKSCNNVQSAPNFISNENDKLNDLEEIISIETDKSNDLKKKIAESLITSVCRGVLNSSPNFLAESNRIDNSTAGVSQNFLPTTPLVDLHFLQKNNNYLSINSKNDTKTLFSLNFNASAIDREIDLRSEISLYPSHQENNFQDYLTLQSPILQDNQLTESPLSVDNNYLISPSIQDAATLTIPPFQNGFFKHTQFNYSNSGSTPFFEKNNQPQNLKDNFCYMNDSRATTKEIVQNGKCLNFTPQVSRSFIQYRRFSNYENDQTIFPDSLSFPHEYIPHYFLVKSLRVWLNAKNEIIPIDNFLSQPKKKSFMWINGEYTAVKDVIELEREKIELEFTLLKKIFTTELVASIVVNTESVDKFKEGNLEGIFDKRSFQKILATTSHYTYNILVAFGCLRSQHQKLFENGGNQTTKCLEYLQEAIKLINEISVSQKYTTEVLQAKFNLGTLFLFCGDFEQNKYWYKEVYRGGEMFKFDTPIINVQEDYSKCQKYRRILWAKLIESSVYFSDEIIFHRKDHIWMESELEWQKAGLSVKDSKNISLAMKNNFLFRSCIEFCREFFQKNEIDVADFNFKILKLHNSLIYFYETYLESENLFSFKENISFKGRPKIDTDEKIKKCYLQNCMLQPKLIIFLNSLLKIHYCNFVTNFQSNLKFRLSLRDDFLLDCNSLDMILIITRCLSNILVVDLPSTIECIDVEIDNYYFFMYGIVTDIRKISLSFEGNNSQLDNDIEKL